MFRGHRDDPLSEAGRQQMHQALAPQERWDTVLTSPLRRCHDFAVEVAGDRQVSLEVDERLRELSFGDWEGRTLEAVQREDGERLSAFWRDADRHPPPNGEGLASFYRRVTAAWTYWTDQLHGQRVLLVGHGGVIRMVLAYELGMMPAAAMARLQVPYACRSRLRIDHGDHGRLASLVHHGVCG